MGEIRQRALHGMQKLTLGELEHVVRLGITKRKILLHHGDQLKPLRIAKAAKEKGTTDVEVKLASPSSATTASTIDSESVASEPVEREEMEGSLRQLMQRFPEGVSLPRIKKHVQPFGARRGNDPLFKCSAFAEVLKQIPS